jgi:vitamin B12 transporter
MKTKSIAGLMFAGVACTVVVPGQAEEPRTVVISATRTERPIEGLGSSVTVISAAEIERSAKRTVIGLFDQVPGLYATETGGFGGTTTVRLRGADTDQTLVLLDGVRVNDPGSASGEFDFSTLLLTDIERIEIVRGPQSALWGSDAIGGIVNIITRRGDGSIATRGSLEGGSFGTVRAGAGVAGGSDTAHYAVSGSYLHTDGFSRVSEAIGARERDGVEAFSVTGKTGLRVTDSYELMFAGSVSGANAETDPSLANVSGDGDADTRRRVYSGQLDNLFQLLDGKLQNRASVFLLRSDRDFYDSRSSSARYTSLSGRSYGGEYLVTADVARDARLTLGARLQTDTGEGSMTRSNGLTVRQYDAEFDTRSAYGQIELQPLQQLNLTLGGRADDFDNGGTHGTWRATGSWLIERTGTRLRASYGTGAKAPTIYQSFYSGPDPAVGGTLTGNRDLHVETSRGFDVGVEQIALGGALRFGVTYFDQAIDDMIQYTNIVFGVSSTYVNLGKVDVEGVESFVKLQPAEWVAIDAGYTRTDAHEAGATSPLARTPRDTGFLGIAFMPQSRLNVGANAVYVGDQFNRTLRRDPIDGFVRVDLVGGFKLNDRVDVFARVENLFDEQYEVIRNAGTAGRSAYGGVRMRF